MKIFTHSQVYEPAEDTFLLLNALDVGKNDSVFEIGTGTGIIALSCTQKGATVVCSDINPYAIILVQKNIIQNKNKLKGSIEVRRGYLFNVLNFDETFDVIVFNPPYLPTKYETLDEDIWLNLAVNGGRTGLVVIKPYLKEISRYVKSNGRGYFIYSSKSDRTLLTRYLKRFHLRSQTISSLSFEDETIEIIKITRLK